jgi:hypothetical protein
MSKARFTWLAVVVLALGAGVSSAADRHVYLDTNGDGQLNDCPNPAHNAKATSNTDELSYCASSGPQNGRIIGTAPGRVSAAACAADAQGAVRPLTSGSLADMDGDGTRESVYAHPQACVWNMAKSIRARCTPGPTATPGRSADESCGNQSQAGLEGNDRRLRQVRLLPRLGRGVRRRTQPRRHGVRTAAAPGWLRAAVMNGSIDSWDPNGDKDPSDGLYPRSSAGTATATAPSTARPARAESAPGTPSTR